jgi:putative FmdB family regulatory protein
MPIYEYRCDQGHTFEVMQRITDDPVERCTACERPVRRVFHPVAVHFKGSGFYNTDYGKQRRGRAGDEGDGGASEGDGAKAADAKAGEGKTESGSSTEAKGASRDGSSGVGTGAKAGSGGSSST